MLRKHVDDVSTIPYLNSFHPRNLSQNKLLESIKGVVSYRQMSLSADGLEVALLLQPRRGLLVCPPLMPLQRGPLPRGRSLCQF